VRQKNPLLTINAIGILGSQSVPLTRSLLNYILAHWDHKTDCSSIQGDVSHTLRAQQIRHCCLYNTESPQLENCAGVWTRGLVLSRQVLYHLRSPFIAFRWSLVSLYLLLWRKNSRGLRELSILLSGYMEKPPTETQKYNRRPSLQCFATLDHLT
jgi:hypothetical protein